MIRTLANEFKTLVCSSSAEAVSDITSSSSLVVGGFGLCGVPENLLRAIHARKLSDLKIITNTSGTNEYGPGLLIKDKMVSLIRASYLGGNLEVENQYMSGEIELDLVPQGSLAERLRAGGIGIAAFYTHTGAGSMVETGGFPKKFAKGGKEVEKYSKPREVKIWGGKKYLLETAIRGDFSLIKAWKADTKGNLVYRSTARNFNSDIAASGSICIAEVEEIVPEGTLDPDEIHTPGIYVDRIVKGEYFDKPIERLTFRTDSGIKIPGTPEQQKKRIRIAKRAAHEVKNGMYVNLGIGMPTLVPNFVDPDIEIILHGENGCLGIGPYPEESGADPDTINAGKETITLIPGSSVFSSSVSFNIVRGHHLNLTILGGLQVSQEGDLANWIVPGKMVKGMGGAMDLVDSHSKCIVCMEHTAKGTPKVLKQCKLPLTGEKVARMLITELGVFEFRRDTGMTLVEIADDTTIDHVKESTEAEFYLASDLSVMKQ